MNQLKQLDLHEKLPNLYLLDLSHNLLEALEVETLASFPNVGYLNVSHNLLRSCPKISLRHLPNLSELNLVGNRFTSLVPSLCFVSKLHIEWAYLSNGRLEKPQSFAAGKHLSKEELTAVTEAALFEGLDSVSFSDYLKFTGSELSVEQRYLLVGQALREGYYSIWKDLLVREPAMLDYEINPVEDVHQHRPDLLLVAVQANQGVFFKELGESQLQLFREKFRSLLPLHHMVTHK